MNTTTRPKTSHHTSRTCHECGHRVRSRGHETICSNCGLVLTEHAINTSPTSHHRIPRHRRSNTAWACEPTTELRADNGLHTTFSLQKDGQGNTLSSKRQQHLKRLRARHERYTLTNDREKRFNEALRDIEMLGANHTLPEFVQIDASRYLKAAKDHRLPGGRMPWEALAAAAILLATTNAGINRTPHTIATSAKAPQERICAAARKIRLQTPIDTPPIRPAVVEHIITALPDSTLDETARWTVTHIANRLMIIADATPVGPGTPRATVAGAAIYTADRLTPHKYMTQHEVATATATIETTTEGKIARYSRDVYTAADSTNQSDTHFTRLQT